MPWCMVCCEGVFPNDFVFWPHCVVWLFLFFLFLSQSINQSESDNLYTLFTDSYDLKTSPILWLHLADHDLHCSVHPTS